MKKWKCKECRSEYENEKTFYHILENGKYGRWCTACSSYEEVDEI